MSRIRLNMKMMMVTKTINIGKANVRSETIYGRRKNEAENDRTH